MFIARVSRFWLRQRFGLGARQAKRLAVLLRARRSRIRRPAATTKGSERAAPEHRLRGETEAYTTRASSNGLFDGIESSFLLDFPSSAQQIRNVQNVCPAFQVLMVMPGASNSNDAKDVAPLAI